ncbi:glutaredoxin family protein [Mangrovitalea sediminis]|uniref:glutaredoxin family protein n=1 Tax=Mangrovitalea sediminis TaxID=1982043 RepID=UPI001303F8B2|nr:glutaredoxin domain-containing protein [Mangrovitalea sediminis]
MKKTVLLLMVWLFSLPLRAGEAATAQPSVYMFTQDFCPACLGAEQYFRDHHIRYLSFDIDKDPKALAMFRRLGARGTPFILVGGKPMTGFDPAVFQRLYDTTR